MSSRTSTVHWTGSLVEGSGTIELPSQQTPLEYRLATRAADEVTTTSPEEMLAAAYASCYAMQLSALLSDTAGVPDLNVDVTVTQGGPEVDFGISEITLSVVCGGMTMSEAEFDEIARTASSMCPIGRALAAVDTVTVSARLSE